jgi:hypothetical protein
MWRLLSVLVTLGSCSLLSAQSWTAWRADAVYHGIEIRERCGGFNEFANRYIWDVQLRNTYRKNVDLAWAAEPERLHGADAQSNRALGVKPGEVVDAQHTAPGNCSIGLLVKVNDVRAANATVASVRPNIEGRWQSKDPEPLRKELVVKLSGDTVTSRWSSPNFSIQISSPLPKGVSGSVSIEKGDQSSPQR